MHAAAGRHASPDPFTASDIIIGKLRLHRNHWLNRHHSIIK
jgi:hypothetical protein